MISFGTPYWANVWLEETDSPYPLFLDAELKAYHLYGLRHSRLRAWSPRTLLYYARAWWRGEPFKPGRGDAHQLGGDFIVDPQGILRLSHPSRDPTDRPRLAQIITLLREINGRLAIRD